MEQQFLENGTMQTNLKIGFIGGGNMATALIGGLAGKLTAGANIHVIDLNSEALQKLQTQFGGNYQLTEKMSLDFGVLAGKFNNPRAGAQIGVSIDF